MYSNILYPSDGSDGAAAAMEHARDLAETYDAIVMGTHGRTGLNRYLIRSVTQKVVRLSDIPVMTVRADEE